MAEAWLHNQTVHAKYFRDHHVSSLGADIYRVGCQEVSRVEVEQLALWQGWEFPTKK